MCDIDWLFGGLGTSGCGLIFLRCERENVQMYVGVEGAQKKGADISVECNQNYAIRAEKDYHKRTEYLVYTWGILGVVGKYSIPITARRGAQYFQSRLEHQKKQNQGSG